MTEEEAKKKWCPMGGRDVKFRDDGINVITATKCMASDCMMWRWKIDLGTGDDIESIATTDGYCGLAGEPND